MAKPVRNIHVVPDFELIYKYKREKDNKDAPNYAEAEFSFVKASITGKKSCKGLRAKINQVEKFEDGSIMMVEDKYTTIGIRLYLEGYMFDIPIGITDYFRKTIDYYYVPSYTANGGSRYVRVMEHPVKGKPGDTVFISALERGRYRGKRYIAKQSLTLEGSKYLIDCYHGKKEFDIEKYKEIDSKSLKYDNYLISARQQELLDEFQQLYREGKVDKTGKIIKQTPPPSTDSSKIQNLDQISDFEGVNNSNVPFSCPVSDFVKIQNLDQISDFIKSFNSSKIQNLDQILDFVKYISDFDFSDIKLIKPIHEDVQEIKNILNALVNALGATKQETPEKQKESVKIPNAKSGIAFVIPPSALNKNGELKNTQVNIYTEKTNKFMVKALEYYHNFNVIQGLSEKKSNAKTLEMLLKYHKDLYDEFVYVNRDKKNPGLYEINDSTITGWYKLHFEIKDGIAVKKEK